MAKRFTDTDKWKKRWYRSLKPAYKCFWNYLCDNCDHSGIWEVDFETAFYFIGQKLNVDVVKKDFGKQILELDNGKRWFLRDFIVFQYGELSLNNRAHKNIISRLKLYDIVDSEGALKGLQSPLEGDKDKDMDMEQDMDMDKVGGVGEILLNVKTEPIEKTIWRSIYLNNPGIAELDFVKKLVEKFGEQRAKSIVYDFKKKGFRIIQTMEDSLNEDGSIKPKEKSNGTNSQNNPNPGSMQSRVNYGFDSEHFKKRGEMLKQLEQGRS